MESNKTNETTVNEPNKIRNKMQIKKTTQRKKKMILTSRAHKKKETINPIEKKTIKVVKVSSSMIKMAVRHWYALSNTVRAYYSTNF